MILGFIAAVVIPAMVNRYHERTTISKVKRTYSQLNQAIHMAIANNGYITSWNVSDGTSSTSATQVASYIKPYLNLKKDCGTKACQGYKQITLKDLNGNNRGSAGQYDSNSKYYKIILSDSTNIWLRSEEKFCKTDSSLPKQCFVIWFDINGSEEPNTFGRDIYVIVATADGINLINQSLCTLQTHGWGCLSYILQNNNMDYLHK